MRERPRYFGRRAGSIGPKRSISRPRRAICLTAATLALGISTLLAPPSAAQTRQASWSLAVTASLSGFRGGSSDTAAGGTAVQPSQGIAVGLGLTKHWSAWALSLQLSHLAGHLEAVSPDVAVRDRTKDFDRDRLEVLVARRVGRPGAGTMEFRLGPTVDGWNLDGQDVRGALGGEAQLAIDLPAGPVTLENVFGLGWSSSPFRTYELPDGYRRRALRTMTVGIGVRFVL